VWGPHTHTYIYIYIHGNMMGEVSEKVSGVFLEWSIYTEMKRNEVKRNVSEMVIGHSRELLLG